MLQRKVNFTTSSLLSCGVTQISPEGWVTHSPGCWEWRTDGSELSSSPWIPECHFIKWSHIAQGHTLPRGSSPPVTVTGYNGPRLLSSTGNNSRAIPAPALPMASAQAFLATTLLCNLFLCLVLHPSFFTGFDHEGPLQSASCTPVSDPGDPTPDTKSGWSSTARMRCPE